MFVDVMQNPDDASVCLVARDEYSSDLGDEVPPKVTLKG
jgi:hypothetical protein